MRACFSAAALGAALAALAPADAAARNVPRRTAAAAAAPAPPAIQGTSGADAASVPLPADALKRLKSGNAAQIASALEDVRASGKRGVAAVPTILELLKRGVTLRLTESALDALGETGSDAGGDVIAWYARHRALQIRRAAVGALGKTGGAAASGALRAALADAEPAVRSLAATGLGSIHAKDAVADLFLALDHHVEEAAASIGQLCAGDECDRLAAKLGSMPFDVVTSGIQEILFRPDAEVNDDAKVKIVGRVRDMGTAEANHFLKDVRIKWPARGSSRVRQAIDQAVLATNAAASAPPDGVAE